MRKIILIVFSIYFPYLMAATSNLSVQKHCDIPANNLSSLPTTSLSICQENCENSGSCAGYTFITGWRMCFLKAKVSSQFTIRIFSGYRDDSGKVVGSGYDMDNSGKDFKKIADIKDKERCLSMCQEDKVCQAFTYIEGYRDCFLKKNHGKAYEKIFYCGKKK